MSVKESFNKVITDIDTLGKHYIIRDGFVFTCLTEPTNVYNAIVIRNPQTADCFSPKHGFSFRTLEEHIEFIKKNEIERAIVIAEDISFINKCPSLKWLNIIPADNVSDFDFSPLYSMQEIRFLKCRTVHGDRSQYISSAKYDKFINLKDLFLIGEGHLNYTGLTELEYLMVSENKSIDTLDGVFTSKKLKRIDILQTSIESLRGIDISERITDVDLSYNRNLKDISDLTKVSKTLKMLIIENCPQINDFSCLCDLTELEHLWLCGKNVIPSLSFLRKMKKLKTITFSMEIADGDLTPCLEIPYAYCKKSKKYYNLKDKDLPKSSIRKKTGEG